MLVGDVLGRGLAARDAGIVDENVDAAVTRGKRVGERSHVVGLGDVEQFGVDRIGLVA